MQLDELLQQRRSVRKYLPKAVERGTVEEILRAAQLAPSWKNSETGRYYVVLGPELEPIRESVLPAFNQKSSAGAALIVSTFVRGVAGHSQGVPDNEPGDKWGAYDLGLQNAYLVLKARDLGLDTLIMGLRDEKALRDRLGIPAEEEVMAVLALGYRDGEPAFRPRKELDEIVKFF